MTNYEIIGNNGTTNTVGRLSMVYISDCFLNTFIQIELISFPVVLISNFSLVRQTVIGSKCEWAISLFYPPIWCVVPWQTFWQQTYCFHIKNVCLIWTCYFSVKICFFRFCHESHIIPFLDSNIFDFEHWTLIWWAKNRYFFILIDLILIWTN